MSCGSILHINVVGLMAAIEERKDSSAGRRPFVVANPRAPRACVLDVSALAHREGLRTGMSLDRARLLLPGLSVCAPRPELCAQADAAMLEAALGFTPLVESAGPGHLFVDLAGTTRLHGAREDAAQKLRADIARRTGLRPAIALASGKTASKVATRVFRPEGFVALSANDESGLLSGQPVILLPGVGPVLLGRLTLLEIKTIGSLAALSAVEARALGTRGPFLVARARGGEEAPVNPRPAGTRSLEGSFLFEPDCIEPGAFLLRLAQVVADLGFELRRGGAGARHASVTVGYTDGLMASATASSAELLTRDGELTVLAAAALERALRRRVRVRRIGVQLAGFGPAGPELDLFEPACRLAGTASSPASVGAPMPAGTSAIAGPGAGTVFSGRGRPGEARPGIIDATGACVPGGIPYWRAGRLQGALDRVRARHGAVALRRAGVFALQDGEAVPRRVAAALPSVGGRDARASHIPSGLSGIPA